MKDTTTHKVKLIGFGQLQTYLEMQQPDRSTNIKFDFRPITKTYKVQFNYTVDIKAVLIVKSDTKPYPLVFVGSNVNSVVSQAKAHYKIDGMF